MEILRLKVEARDPSQAGANLPAAIGPLEQLGQGSSPLLLELSGGSDCILHARLDPSLPPGVLLTDIAQQHNLRLVPKEHYSFSIFAPPSSSSEDPFDLVELEAEVLLLSNTSYDHGHSSPSSSSSSSSSSGGRTVQVDAQELTSAFCKSCHGRILAVNEHVVLEHQGQVLLLRVTSVNAATEEEREEMIGYHCFRGRLCPDTQVYLKPAWEETGPQQQGDAAGGGGSSSSSHHATNGHGASAVRATQQQLGALQLEAPQQQQQQREGHHHQPAAGPAVPSRVAALAGVAAGGTSQPLQRLQLVNVLSRAQRPPPTNVVHITTSDGEWFPVKKKLLRPCIELTQVVRDAGDTAPSVTVDIDCLTFDRVLMFLEALALGQEPLPSFPLKYLDDLARAAKLLGLRSLARHCEQLAGRRTAALARYSPAQVAQAIAEGAIWLLLDGMVLDVGVWLPQHPGGTAIIPKQAMNNDCSRFFEMYHASRESFLYLKEFYVGELYPPEAAAQVPLGGGQPPSAEFMAQLREYTHFRKDPQQLPDSSISVAFKSF